MSTRLAWGLVGLVAFSLTLPATRFAVAYLDPVFVGLGRAVVAATIAAGVLIATRAPRPALAVLGRLAIIALGVVGFPLFSAYAMRHVPASHGAVVVGLLPLATAVAAALFAHERPSPRFWACALAGSVVVERLDLATFAAAALIVATIALGRRG